MTPLQAIVTITILGVILTIFIFVALTRWLFKINQFIELLQDIKKAIEKDHQI